MDSKTFLTTGRKGVASISEPANNVLQPIPGEKHFSATFYAELWGISNDDRPLVSEQARAEGGGS